MKKQSKRVVVSGAGLFGSAVYAFLTHHENLEVILAEAADRVGGGSTRKNHGRLHAGATGVYTDPETVTKRKMIGNRIISCLPQTLENDSPAIYCYAPDIDQVLFYISCLDRQISTSPLRQPRGLGFWLNQNVANSYYQVPEFAFNPARLARRLAELGHERGGKVWLNSKVTTIRRKGRGLSVKIQHRDPVSASFVINCNSKYANSIKFEDRSSLLDLEFHRWPVMSISSEAIKRRLNNVLVVVDSNGLFPSMIPHGEFITFDSKTTPSVVESPDAYPLHNPKRFNPAEPQEVVMFDEVRRAFKPLAQLSVEDFRKHVAVFYGIHGRRRGEITESDISKSFRYQGVDNYLIRHGGLATTSILDALETVEEVERELSLPSSTHRDRVVQLVHDLNKLRERDMLYQDNIDYELDFRSV